MRSRGESPLRYPGGKTMLYKNVRRFIYKNGLRGSIYTEPFAGGSGLALKLLLNGDVKKIHLNDYDRGIYAFWHSVLNSTEELIKRIINTPITIDERNKQKNIQSKKDTSSLIDLGFSTLFLNRVNRSGILKAGVIGGKSQKGEYKLDCRFNKVEIIRKITNIASRKEAITLTFLDALELMKTLDTCKKHFLYLDPPYFVKGQGLYMNFYKKEDHVALREYLFMSKFKYIVSYDDCTQIREIYNKERFRTYTLVHNVSNKGVGKEIMYFSKGIRIPESMFYDYKVSKE